ncbi:hypothetical protein MVEN_01551700 [Mycena venus]|uniref:Uncharacterized protein n=1 Tax=Mycena venus TaxID=2733690 RepID=A0A8H7CUJ3_9AGAR|nr:hypothetical protein MVEN_01551700 [Mycena venus]
MSHKEPSSDLLRALQAAASPVDNLEHLLTSSRQAFQILEPWYHRKSDVGVFCLLPGHSRIYITRTWFRSEHAAVQNVIVQVRAQAQLYFKAIDTSVDSSEHGVTFTAEAIDLCEFLRREEPTEHLVAFIEDLRNIACEAHKGAKATLSSFEDVRRGILQVMAHIPWTAEQVVNDIQLAEKSGHLHSWIETGAKFLGGTLGSGTAALAGVAVALPVLMFILPVVLPLMVLVAGKIEERARNNVELRKQQELSHKEALLQLEHINAALNEMLKNINLFASWWSAMETHLLNIKVHVQKFGASNLDSLSLEMVKHRWTKVSNQYRSYVSEISKLRDFYPHDVQLLSRVDPHRNFAPIMASLIQNTDACQIAYRHVWIACAGVNRKKHSVDARPQLHAIKTQLMAVWETLCAFLRDLLFFEQGSLTTLTIDGSNDVVISTDAVKDRAQALIDLHLHARDLFSSNKDALSKHLLGKQSHRKARILKDLRNVPDKGADSDDTRHNDFLEECLGASQPGRLLLLEGAIDKVGSSLRILYDYLDIVLGHSAAVLPTWRCFDGSVIHAAISALSTSLECLTIEAPDIPNAERFHLRQLIGRKL